MTRKLWRVLVGVILTLVVAGGAYVGYLCATYRIDYSAVPLPSIAASTEPAVIAHGAYVVHAIAHCSACHGDPEFTNKHQLSPDPNDLRGGYTLHAGPFGTFYPSNLTSDPETGIAKLSDAQLARVIRHGVGPAGGYDPLMALAVGPLSDEDLTAVVSYLRSLPSIKHAVPADEWGLLAKVLSRSFTPRMSHAPPYVPAGAVSKERGEYLANGPALCFGCHSPIDKAAGFAEVGPRFSGAIEPEPDMFDENFEFVPPNLTPDPETGVIANYTEESFIARFREIGALNPGSDMPWANFKQMTDEDLKSIFVYLRSLPPTKHATGPRYRKRGWTPEKS